MKKESRSRKLARIKRVNISLSVAEWNRLFHISRETGIKPTAQAKIFVIKNCLLEIERRKTDYIPGTVQEELFADNLITNKKKGIR